MPRLKTFQTNFGAGELAPDIRARQDTEQYQNGALSLRNRRCLIGGGTKRRPGSWRRSALLAAFRLVDLVVNQATKYVLSLSDGSFFAYAAATGAAAGSLGSCPWTGDIWSEMDYAASGDTLFLVHEDMWPQIVTRTGAASWSRAAFAFFVGAGGRIEQPYYKVADPAVTMQPSGLTGSITLTASADVFQSGHVGVRFRYVGREVEITAVASGVSATATVIESLPGTFRLTVGSTSGMAAGEVVEGSSSGAKGIIATVVSTTQIDVVLYQKLIPFTTSDTVVAPKARSACSATITATAAAVTDWDEALFSAVRGYPSCVTLHRNRLLFAGHPAVPNALLASRVDNLYSFDVDDASDGDAIFETIGDAGAAEIEQLHSAEQLLVLTDRGAYYCPESAGNPFRPSSISFVPFGSPWPISPRCKAQAFDDGVLFVSGSNIIKARPTGDLTRSWQADEVSLLASHLVDAPTALTVVSGLGGGPERYAIARNADGTLVALQLVEAQRIRNMTPWDTTGTYDSVVGIGDQLFAAVRRSIAGSTQYLLEEFDQDVTLDAATEYATEAALAGIPTTYGATPVNVVTGRYSLGTYPLTLTDPPAGPYTVGLAFVDRTETLPPSFDGRDGPRAGETMRIVRAWVRVRNSARFAANGYTLSAYAISDPLDEAPPAKDGWYAFTFLGWSREPTVVLQVADPLALEILAIKTEVAY